jgi:hypothetical protein
MWNMRYPQQCCRWSKTFGMWHCVIGRVFPNILKDHCTFIIRVSPRTSWFAWSWRWRHYYPSKCWELLPQRQSVTLHKVQINKVAWKPEDSNESGTPRYLIYLFLRIMYNELKSMWKTTVEVISRYNSGIWLWGLRRDRRNLCQVSLRPNQDSKQPVLWLMWMETKRLSVLQAQHTCVSNSSQQKDPVSIT